MDVYHANLFIYDACSIPSSSSMEVGLLAPEIFITIGFSSSDL